MKELLTNTEIEKIAADVACERALLEAVNALLEKKLKKFRTEFMEAKVKGQLENITAYRNFADKFIEKTKEEKENITEAIDRAVKKIVINERALKESRISYQRQAINAILDNMKIPEKHPAKQNIDDFLVEFAIYCQERLKQISSQELINDMCDYIQGIDEKFKTPIREIADRCGASFKVAENAAKRYMLASINPKRTFVSGLQHEKIPVASNGNAMGAAILSGLLAFFSGFMFVLAVAIPTFVVVPLVMLGGILLGSFAVAAAVVAIGFKIFDWCQNKNARQENAKAERAVDLTKERARDTFEGPEAKEICKMTFATPGLSAPEVGLPPSYEEATAREQRDSYAVGKGQTIYGNYPGNPLPAVPVLVPVLGPVQKPT